MRVFIESTEGDLPEDILKLNETLRGRDRSWTGPFPQRRTADEADDMVGLEDEEEDEEGAPFRSALPRRRPLFLRPQPVNIDDTSPSPKYPLERWLVQAHAYKEEQAAKVSILGRLFSGEANRVKAGVIHDAKRFSVVETEKPRKVEIGVAVRLVVATSSANANFELTLPNIAADAQLNKAEARIGITVVGYTGPLGDILPAPRKLDVETCAEYIAAFRKIQAVIFGRAGWQYVVPTAISYEEQE
jgi:hypothetical protein